MNRIRTARHGVVAALLVITSLAWLCAAQAGAQGYPPPAGPPSGEDRSYGSLHAYIDRLNAGWRDYRSIALDWKAEFYEWEMWRYHLTEMEQVYGEVVFSEQTGVRPATLPQRDMSTWNGSLMAALSFKYAVTREPETLRRLAQLVRGMHFFFQVTEVPGLPARAIHPTRWPNDDHGRMDEYTAPDGRKWYVVGDPAKGGFNQIAAGYAALMMYAAQDLPADVQKLARDDMIAMVTHLVRNKWKATGKTGPTTYGDLTPIVAGCGVPFNAQVAYEIIALGHNFLPADPPQAALIESEYRRLRDKYHCYFEYPLHSLVLPQRVGGSPFVKGMNDRNHVVNAAFIGLMLDIERSRRTQTPYDGTFVHHLGQTMLHGMEELYDKRNSLCTFMWAGVTRDPQVFAYIVPQESDRRNHVNDTARAMVDGVEQLRRFKLNRWMPSGAKFIETKEIQWFDAFRPEEMIWKRSPFLKIDYSGATESKNFSCAIDYLYAYWIFRYFHLEDHAALKQTHAPVLHLTPGLRTWNVE